MSQRYRPIVLAAAALVLAWALALGGFALARHLKVTPEKIRAYIQSVDFASLSPAERQKALRKLAAMLNALSPEDRRAARMSREWDRWFRAMNTSEKGEFLDLTLPTGFTQMLTAFEQLSEEKRKKAIEGAVQRLKEARDKLAQAGPRDAEDGAGPGSELSPELRDKVVKLGVRTFMDQGTPETKAELQPVLEEMQRNMENVRLFQPRRPRQGP